MKIATFNVNSLRVRLPIVLTWLTKHQPDILCVQETKVQDHDFPTEVFEQTGYNYIFRGQKTYNGVAIFSKHKITNVKFGLDNEPFDKPRLAKAQITRFTIVNTYIPQGYLPDSEKFQYKLNWFKRLGDFFKNNFKSTEPLIWVGDFNVAPEPIDVYDPKALLGHVCFCPEVSIALQNIIKWGFTDIFRKHCKEAGQYTFFDYRARSSVSRNLGWRLDHIMATKPLAEKSINCYIDRQPRLEQRPSDHTPLVAEFDW